MRESGLVVTEQRVTVELRTTGTLLCLPLMIQLITSTKDKEDDGQPTLTLFPSEEYLKPLADMANERMAQNEVLLDKLYNAVEDGLFEQQKKDENRRRQNHRRGAPSPQEEVLRVRLRTLLKRDDIFEKRYQ